MRTAKTQYVWHKRRLKKMCIENLNYDVLIQKKASVVNVLLRTIEELNNTIQFRKQNEEGELKKFWEAKSAAIIARQEIGQLQAVINNQKAAIAKYKASVPFQVFKHI